MDFLDALDGTPNADHPSGTYLPSIQNIVVIIIGIIAIGIGLSTFKTTQTVIEAGTTIAKKGAALAA